MRGSDYPTIGIVEHGGVRANGQLDDLGGHTMCVAPGDVMPVLRSLGDRLRHGMGPNDKTIVTSELAFRLTAMQIGLTGNQITELLNHLLK